VSDLHCAATVLITRHGEAEDETGRPSDSGGSLTLAGRRESARLADSLGQRNVAMVYTSPLAQAVQTAEIVAGRLGCVVRVRAGLAELPLGDHSGRPGSPEPFARVLQRWRAGDLSAAHAGAEDGAATVARVQAVLEEVADLHRGETVLVVSHGSVMSLVLAGLAADLPDDHAAGRPDPSCIPVELSADADGWTCTRWPRWE
jgi:broad specificity phosphatase PhoE